MTDKLYCGAAAHVNYQPNTCMRTQLLKKLSVIFSLGLALLGANHRAAGQLLVQPSGLPAQTFDAAPAASEWATLSIGPRVGGGVITSGTAMDTAIQTNTAAGINVTLHTNATAAPLPTGFAQWNSISHNLQTKADTNWYVLLKATLRNNTGSNIVSVTISYDLATAAGTVTEQVPGHRVYYSLTGATGTWVRVPGFDSASGTDNSLKTATLNLGFWAPNAPLYLFWADPNASGANNTEGGYSIDNFAVKATPPQEGPPTIVTQPQSQTVGFPNQATFSVNANGTIPLFYQWFKDNTAIGGATSSSYTIDNATVADQGSYYVVVTNSLGTATSSSATLTVTCVGGAPVAISSQPADQSLGTGGTISLSVSATGTTPVYQWYRNGAAIVGATASTYTKAGAQSGDSGLYSVVVKNCAGPVTSRDAVVSVSTPSYELMPLTNYVWKYEQSGTDLGTAWRTNSYNDTAWPSGLGVFAFENAAAVVALTHTTLNHFDPDYITRYFRTSFVLTNDPATVTLVSSNYIDDGVVVYVNGAEAFRYNMPGGNTQFSTTAIAANPAGEGVPIVSNIPPTLLVQGNNVIAVELHQNSTGSSDSVFGMALIANFAPPSPVSITSQPQSLTVEETKTATFTVGIQGTPAYFQWYKDGVAISNATANPFIIPVVSINDAGSYYVVISNVINSVTSAIATLTVLADTNPPVIVEADGTVSATNVLVSFSELVLPSFATNVANYKITNTQGGTLVITNAVLQNGSNVLLRTTTPRATGSNYILIVSNVRDVSPRQNVIIANSMYPIRSLVPLIALDSSGWRFIDPYPPFDTDPGAAGTQWKEFNYDTTGWSDGGSVFYDAGDPSVISGPLGTSLGQTPLMTSYFRKPFVLQASPSGLEFSLTHLIDDGAVLYLNGTEFYRFNMPSGPVTTSTPPATVIADVSRLGPFKLSIPAARFGTNMFAAELHQPQGADIDKVFGVQLDATVQSFVVGPVIITGGPRDIVVPEGQPATFSVVQAGGSIFQWQTNNINIPGATNATYTIPFVTQTMNGANIRVVVSNATSGATSTNATLRVIGDTNAPALVGAALTTNGTIVVSFSEQVNTAAATTSNYRITNSAGANIPITGAVLAGGNSNVVLTVGNLPANSYTVIVSNVQDRATIPNMMSPNPSAARIGFEGSVQLIGLAGTWKYDQSGTDLGTAWRAVGYNDSAWPSGQGMFGLETGTTEPEPIRTAWTVDTKVTYYLRTTINAPMGGSRATLRVRFILDDGAVFYLNGVEFQRVRIADGPVTFTTLAANPPAEGVYESFDAVITNLVAGPNLIAVEVHQSGTASSDVVFGSEITLLGVDSTILQPPVQIVTQPQSQTAAAGSTASFNVVATGAGPLYYQWLKGGVSIPNATSSTYTITNVQPSHAGNYSVIVTNSFSSATSSVAILTIGGGCQPTTSWTNSLRFMTNGTNAVIVAHNGNVTTTVLSWTNPATNSCGSNATVVLQRAVTLGNTFPVPSTLWTNIYTNVFGYARVTNSVTNNNEAYYRLRVP
jgi:hypothetical protein